MNLFLRFRKDYFNYLISIILPALLSGISIPVFKHLLGAEKYGSFSIHFNAVLIAAATITGWITQSIIRFCQASTSKSLFAKQAVSITFITLALFALPFFALVYYYSKDLLITLLMCASLFVAALQYSYLAIAQSGFLSKKTIYSETIRAVAYILFAVFFLTILKVNYLWALFMAVIISFSSSVLYLKRQAHAFTGNALQNPGQHDLRSLIRKFFFYGSPLSVWIVFFYMLSYVDKLFMLRRFGPEMQGNYQAIFDFLSRSITLILSPIITSLLPLLTMAYDRGEIGEIKSLLKKIVLFEIAGFILASILYWWFGAALLLKILKTPDTFTYRLMGYYIIAGSFAWQVAIIFQKKFELKLKSFFLMLLVAVAFLFQVVFYITTNSYNNPLLFPLGYLLSALVYLVLVSYSQTFAFIKPYLKKATAKQAGKQIQ